MNRIVKISLMVVLVSLLAVGGASVALAQGPDDGTPPPRQGFPGGFGMRGMMGFAGGPPFEAMAEALGLTTDELQAALLEGKTLYEIAEERGVDWLELHTQMWESRLQARAEALQRLVESGKISQETADAALARMTEGHAERLAALESGEFAPGAGCPGIGAGGGGFGGRMMMGRGGWFSR